MCQCMFNAIALLFCCITHLLKNYRSLSLFKPLNQSKVNVARTLLELHLARVTLVNALREVATRLTVYNCATLVFKMPKWCGLNSLRVL